MFQGKWNLLCTCLQGNGFSAEHPEMNGLWMSLSLQYYSTDFGSIGLIQMSPIALPLMCILLVNGIRLQREPGAMRIPLARSMGSIMMFTALKAYGLVPEGDRFWGCLSCSSDNCRTFSQKPKTSTEQSGTSWKQEGHLQMYHSTMRYTQLQEFAKGSIDVPSIRLGRGFVTRGLESYESSEHPMHPWVIARTWTRSCKRWSEKFDFTSDPPSTQTFSTFQHVREFAVGYKETVARACRVPLGLCGGLVGRCADLRQSGRLASCLLRPPSSNCKDMRGPFRKGKRIWESTIIKFTEGNATMMQHSQLETGTVGCTWMYYCPVSVCTSEHHTHFQVVWCVLNQVACDSNFSGRALDKKTYPAVDFQ